MKYLLFLIVFLVGCSDDEQPPPPPLDLLSSIELQDGEFGSRLDITDGEVASHDIIVLNAPLGVQKIRENLAIYFESVDASAVVSYAGSEITSGASVSFASDYVELSVVAPVGSSTYKINLVPYSEEASTLNEYGVYTAEHLSAIRTNIAPIDGKDWIVGKFKFQNDITLPATGSTELCQENAIKLGISDYCQGGWLPIGSGELGVLAEINGNGYNVDGLYMSRAADRSDIYGGVFARLDTTAAATGSITALGVNILDMHLVASQRQESPTNTYHIYAGGLVGLNKGVVKDSQTSGRITAASSVPYYATGYIYAGGLVGKNEKAIMYSSTSAEIATIGANNVYTGGLVGYNRGNIEQAFASGKVSSESNSKYNETYGGGLVGITEGVGSSIKSSYATGTTEVFARLRGYAGGLVGSNYTLIESSYALGTISATASQDIYGGGLIGYNSYALINNTFATGNVSVAGSPTGVVGDEDFAGGLVGYSQAGTITNSYAIGNTTCTGSDCQSGAVNGKNFLTNFTNIYRNSQATIKQNDISCGEIPYACGDATAPITARTLSEMETSEFKDMLNAPQLPLEPWAWAEDKNKGLPYLVW